MFSTADDMSSGKTILSLSTSIPFHESVKVEPGIIVGVVLIVIGAAVLIDEYDLIPDFDFGRLWPVVLVLVGASLIVSGQRKQPWHHDNWNDAGKPAAAAADASANEAAGESEDHHEPQA